MPITLTTPILITETLGQANWYQIMGFSFLQPHNGEPVLRIECWAAHYTPGDPSATPPVPETYQTVKAWTEEIRGDDLTKIAQTVVTGQTLYDAIKQTLYGYLQKKGIFPLV